ncbi:MAG: hypothetical protein V4587_01240 [Acidobacteriota bacterium]
MQRLTCVMIFITIFFTVRTVPLHAAQIEPAFDVHGPTVVAFFPPETQSDMSHGETDAALDDFQFYAERSNALLTKAGVDFHEVFAHSFRLRFGTKTTTFHPQKVAVGYYLVAPGKKPCVRYGVMTDTDLLQVADKYFGLVLK